MKTDGKGTNLRNESGNQPKGLSARELARILVKPSGQGHFTRQALEKQADRDGWLFDEVPVRGGLKKIFLISGMPANYRRQILVHYGVVPERISDYVTGNEAPKPIEECIQAWDRATEPQRELAKARVEVLRACEALRRTHKYNLHGADDRFVAQYAKHDVIGIDPQVYGAIKKVSRSRLHEWQRRYQEQGVAGLITDKRANLGRTRIPLEQQQFILETVANNPRWGRQDGLQPA